MDTINAVEDTDFIKWLIDDRRKFISQTTASLNIFIGLRA